MASLKLILTVLCLVALAGRLELSSCNPSNSKQASNEEERLPFGPDGSLFLAGNECGPDEQLAPGQLPTCEPTCANPKPVCSKVFFSSIDYVPCFCKAPLVRNLQTKQCVPLAECPPQTQATRAIRPNQPK